MRSLALLARLVRRGFGRARFALAVLTSLAALSSDCAPSLSVRTGWDPHAEFAKYHAWTWKPDADARDVAWERRSRSVIAEELARHGLEEASDPARADLWCVVHARISPQTRLAAESEWSFEMGPYGGGWGYDETVTRQVPVGTVVVELVDPARKQVVWRARANDVIRADLSEDERDRNLAAAVREMFVGYPPPPGSIPETSTAAK
jgi:hypothetical protein